MAGNDFDEAIIRHVRKAHNLFIGEQTAEAVKMKIGTVCKRPQAETMEVKGRNVITGLPKTATVTSEEVREALQECTTKIVEAVHSVLEKTPPELAADIVDRGIVLTGGGSLLDGFEEVISQRTGINTMTAENLSLIHISFAEKTLELPDEEEERQMYERTGEILQSYGYQQYEISNYAKPGKECQHNLGYWTRREYLGFGVGSASLFQNQRFTNLRDRSAYAAFDGKVESIRRDLETLTVREQMEETMILGLRLIRGVSRSEFQKNFGVSVGEIYGPVSYTHLDVYKRQGIR